MLMWGLVHHRLGVIISRLARLSSSSPFLFLSSLSHSTSALHNTKLNNTMRFLDSSLHERTKILSEQPILISTCCSLSVRAHDSSYASPFVVHSLTNPYPCAIFAFCGSWIADEWISGGKPPFGESEMDPSVFPSLRSVGSGVIARVNASFLSSFQRLLVYSSFQSEVSKAISEGKRVIFTGHSSGGAIAVLASTWLIESHAKSAAPKHLYPFCIAFGAPLIGDSVFNHALEREGWSHNFLHFIMSIDLIPRILLSPVSIYNFEIQTVLNFLSPKASNFGLELIQRSNLVPSFYESVLKNALSVSSYQACVFMGCTNPLMGTLTSFVELSPYRPFGTFVFCTSEGRVIVMENSDAILQLLFYFMQLNPHEQLSDVAYRSLNEHWLYESKLKEWILRNGEGLSFITSESDLDGSVFSELKLGKEAKLRLCAAMQLEKQRQKNQSRIDTNCIKIREALNSLNNYKTTCELKGISYYDSFKLQRNVEDFNANVKRIELAGLWDEIVEMLRRNELPDCFEGRAEWVNLGTVYRRLVEPLDIANYYRHSKNEDTGSYLLKGRPRRYRYTQRWYEQAERMEVGKRGNRTAKLKQCKMDARREQWLSQVNKEGKGSRYLTMNVPPNPPLPQANKKKSKKREERERDQRNESVFLHEMSDSDSPSLSPNSNLSNNGRPISSGSSVGSSSQSISDPDEEEANPREEEDELEEGESEENDVLDDWEAVADALTNQSIQLSNPSETLTLTEPPNPQPLKTEPVHTAPRAWRPDDAFRPQSLPSISKQMSFPSSVNRHFDPQKGILAMPSSCPICYEDLDSTDSSFLPCLCGFRLCLFCHKRILEADARCPGCRKKYEADPVVMEVKGSVNPQLWANRLSRSCSMNSRY